MALPVFPSLPGISWPVRRSPMWKGVVQTAISGRESELGLWSYPRYQIEVPFQLLRAGQQQQEWQTLLGFYNQVKASGAKTFLFADQYDGAVAGQDFGQGDGATTAFQLVRTLGGFDEPVFAPTGTPTVTVGGVATNAFTLGSTGVVTFTAPPAAGAQLAWTGAYSWICKFDKDQLDFENFMYNYWRAKSVTFTTVKP